MEIEVNARKLDETGGMERIEKMMEVEAETTIKEVLFKLGYDNSLKSLNVVVNGRKKPMVYELNPDDK